jgi:uncharacterized protein (TIGR02145 family)
MRRLIFVLLIGLGFGVAAQDLVYKVSALSNSMGMSLDSILVENISGHQKLLFGNLPVRTDYIINLNQLTLGESTSSVLLNEKQPVTVLTNQPGILSWCLKEGRESKGAIAVYNLNGQELFRDNSVSFRPYQQVSLKIGLPGIFLVSIYFGSQTVSVKAEGAPAGGQIEWFTQESNASLMKLKSGSSGLTADFQFFPGDSIRISVFKKSYYAYPESFRIKGSEALSFVLTPNTAAVTGVSNIYRDLSGKAKLLSYDDKTGTAVYSYPDLSPGLKYGDVIVVGTDTAGYLRKVTGSNEKEGLATVRTIQATLNEIFINKEVKLSTQWMDPLFTINENSPEELISKAMTDYDGFCHPVKIIYKMADGQVIIRNPVLDPGSEKPDIPSVSFTKSLSKTEVSDDKNVSLVADKGNISLSSNALLSLLFRGNGRLDDATKAEIGDLSEGSGNLYGRCNVTASLILKGVNSLKKDFLPKKIADIQRITFKFLVAGIPVWLEVNISIFQRWRLSIPDNFSSAWSYGDDVSFQTGWTYKAGNGIFTPVFSCTSIPSVTSLISDEQSGGICRISFFPSAEIFMYGVPVMTGESQPFSQADYYGKSQTVSIAGVQQPFLAWNSLLYSGTDNRAEAHLAIAGVSDVSFDSGEINCDLQNPSKSPYKLVLQPALPGQVNLSSRLSLSFRVTDDGGSTVSGCAVFIQGDGSWSSQLLTSDSNGEVKVDWTVSPSPGFNDFKAQIFNADKFVISEVKDSLRVIDKDAYGTVVYDGKSYKTKKFGSAEWMTENLAYLPAVSSPTPGSNTLPYYYVPGFFGSGVTEAKSTPGYSLYGVMYNWPAAVNGQSSSSGGTIRGICPPGWHLPGEKDWVDLWSFLVNGGYGFGGSGNQIAKAMASKTNWNTSWFSGTPGNNPDSNNTSEFSGLPGGYRCTDAVNFTNEGLFCSWWAASEKDTDYAFNWGISNTSAVLVKYYSLKSWGYFVRCVKD